tara:strand:+ start:1259 stop:2569 length:1311 start_codon:yes stop_codon:yes gene_type:complete
MNKEKLVVVGSGISGLSASFFLSHKFDVCLLEKNNYLGGHTRTKKIEEDNNLYNIDTGFIVFNENNYPDLISFFNFLNIETANSDMSFSYCLKKLNFEYGGSNFRSLFAQPKNFLSLKFIFLINEIRKLYNDCNNFIFDKSYENLTIEEFLEKKGYSNDLKNLHIYPMISSIWSCNQNNIKNFPFVSFLNFFKNHGLFKLKKRPIWKYVVGGSKVYVDKLVEKKYFDYQTNCLVKKIIRNKDKIIIQTNKQKEIVADKLVLATHADQSLSILEKPSEIEKKILSQFKYTKNEAFLHSDDNFMPNNKAAWSSWNFISNNKDNKKFSLTYWMNNLQKIKSKKNYFVTINPELTPKSKLDFTIFEHPIFDLNTIKAQQNLSLIQGNLNTYYCGSYCGYGFHEDGIQSAAFIAKKLNINLPWKRNKDFENRLYYNNKFYD